MKVLSIREPWASLIVNGYKIYEFRSWNPKFRGKFLIHASKQVEKDMVKHFSSLGLTYAPGSIIGSATFTDVIPVSKEFEDGLVEENELVYGVSRGRGGYALKLENVEKFDIAIPCKGQLGFFNYYEAEEVLSLMEDISYGWVDACSKTHSVVDSFFSSSYMLQTPQEVMKNKIGVCFDQVELERYYLKNNDWNIKTYFLVYYDGKMCPAHTFLTYEKDGKVYWLEHAYEKFRGIHAYATRKELLKDVRDKFRKDQLKEEVDFDKLVIHEYEKPPAHIGCLAFYQFCDQGKYIDLEKE